MNNQFIIILSGPPAAGKNTTALKVCQDFPSMIAEINLDKIKFFVHRAPNTDFFLDLASEIGQSIARIYLKNQLNLVIHKAFCSYQFVRPFITIADEMRVTYAYFKLTAPLDILLERNRRRNCPTDESELKRIYEFDQANSHPQGISIDTMKYNIQETTRYIIDTINAKMKYWEKRNA